MTSRTAIFRPRSLASLLALSLSVAAISRSAGAQEGESSGDAAAAAAGAEPNTSTAVMLPQEQPDLNSYLPSSSRPSSGGSQDGFDLNSRPSGGSVVISGSGEADAYGDLGGDPSSVEGGAVKKVGQAVVPEFHMVKKGDTLWALSNGYYGDPHEWPRLWSMNPQVENPHWIYPGDQLRTAPGARASSAVAGGPSEDNSAGRGGFVGRDRVVPPGTVFLRDQGYIGDPDRDVWGELVGSKEDQMLLGEGNTVYMTVKPGVDLRIGQRLNLFKEVRSPDDVSGARQPEGELVKVYGTVRIDYWDKKERVARGKLIESLDVVERGTKVGPVGRRFDVVPPKASSVDVEARILSSIYPSVYVGRNQIVFIDKGSKDGLVPGNRLRVLQRGDVWRHNLKTGAKHQRTRARMDASEDAVVEDTPLEGDDETFPDEVVGELTVVRAEEGSALCMVTQSAREISSGERAVATKGY